MSRKSEREARERAAEILKRHPNGRRRPDGEIADGANPDGYGSGHMTKAQKRSQENHIPWTPGPQTLGQKIWRKLV